MASIDYQEARKEIIKAFRAQAGGGRKILFWYDAPAIFKEDIMAESRRNFWEKHWRNIPGTASM